MHDKDKKAIGAKLKAKRDDAGLTMRELAQRAGCHYSAICYIENGNREPRITLLAKLAASLGCTLNDFVEISLENY